MIKKIDEITRHTYLIVIIALIWTAGVGTSLFWNKIIQDSETDSFARIQAEAVLFKGNIFWEWITLKGDIYAPVKSGTVPNPYLDIPERDVTLSTGQKYTLINPAFMTRESLDLQNSKRHILGRITSLTPIRPLNAPDEWEASVLRDFARGAAEGSIKQVINGARYFRLMYPLVTDESCLRCHAKQGYTVGSIRGGISVSIPLEPISKTSREHFAVIFGAHCAIWVMGLLVILIWTRYSRAHVVEKTLKEKELLIKDTAISASSNALVLTDTEGVITYANEMFYNITRIPEGEKAEGRSLFELLGIDGADGIIDDINEMGKWFAEVTARRSDSHEYHILVTAALISHNSVTIGMTFSIADISMRKNAETALKESREALKQRNDLMEKDMEIAQLVQNELIPMEAPLSDFLDIHFSYIPLEKVGGDIFSFFPTREASLGVFIGDVTGHGVAAALFHSLIKSATENIGRKYSGTPAEYMNRLNNELTGRMTSYFMTAVYGSFTKPEDNSSVNFTFSNGGHPTPVLIRKNGTVELFPAGGTLLGLVPDYSFTEESVTLYPGDRVYLYTDGMPEASDESGTAIGFDDKLAEFFKSNSRPGMKDTIDAVVEQIRKFCGSRPLSDDLLIIGIEVRL